MSLYRLAIGVFVNSSNGRSGRPQARVFRGRGIFANTKIRGRGISCFFSAFRFRTKKVNLAFFDTLSFFTYSCCLDGSTSEVTTDSIPERNLIGAVLGHSDEVPGVPGVLVRAVEIGDGEDW